MTEKENKIGSNIDELLEMYNNGLQYQSSLSITATLPECVKFYEGDQWAKATDDTKTLPRPVINFVEMICNNKKSQVLSSPIKIVYKAGLGDVSVDKFNRFAEYQQTRLKQDEINNKACFDGIIKGSYCLYYYWDTAPEGTDSVDGGDIGVQVIDPLNVLFANPLEKEEQKQEWIIIVSSESVAKIKEIADADVPTEDITADETESAYNEVTSDTQKTATVLTRFFRVSGEVYFERATKSVVFNKARPFTPDVEGATAELLKKKGAFLDETTQGETTSVKPKITKYPIVFGQWKNRDKSIYGRGEVEGIIKNQKAVNGLLGLQVLSAQNEAMSAIVVSEDALRGQVITNEAGQVITDYSKTGNGIRYLAKQGMSKASVDLASHLIDLTRVVCGASEIMSGEVIGANMSGSAIAQLQSQALKPIEDLQRGFWRSIRKVGEILEQFLRFFYTGKKFTYADKNGNSITDEFSSDEYQGKTFDVVAEAVAGTLMSEVGYINFLDGLFAKGAIDLKSYIECYPANMLSNRQRLLEVVAGAETMQKQQLQQQLQQMQQQLQASNATLNNAKTIVDENRRLKEELLALQAEYTQKMTRANAILSGAQSKATEYRTDAQEFAEVLARSGAVRPPSVAGNLPQQPENGFSTSINGRRENIGK